ncbi:hypothetical protein CRN76_00505 [Chryseobacterium indologenes]|nr:hypothetical protein CEQ15_14175 [Chryseobacterium indologenes]ATN04021.1 hypothetical protein CRN76_00505 [Chryseobacterium indologenes]AYY83314.1 hypothetical protein EGX91_01395 [Chryseobacterium indologenes]
MTSKILTLYQTSSKSYAKNTKVYVVVKIKLDVLKDSMNSKFLLKKTNEVNELVKNKWVVEIIANFKLPYNENR